MTKHAVDDTRIPTSALLRQTNALARRLRNMEHEYLALIVQVNAFTDVCRRRNRNAGR